MSKYNLSILCKQMYNYIAGLLKSRTAVNTFPYNRHKNNLGP